MSYGGGPGYSPRKIFENLGSFWAILRHLVAWLYKVIFWTLGVAKLKMKLGLTAASKASRYMDRPQLSKQAAAGVWGRSRVQGQSPWPDFFFK